jgi:hypothetical protein
MPKRLTIGLVAVAVAGAGALAARDDGAVVKPSGAADRSAAVVPAQPGGSQAQSWRRAAALPGLAPSRRRHGRRGHSHQAPAVNTAAAGAARAAVPPASPAPPAAAAPAPAPAPAPEPAPPPSPQPEPDPPPVDFLSSG